MSPSPTFQIRILVSADQRVLSGVSAFSGPRGPVDEAEGVMNCVIPPLSLLRQNPWQFQLANISRVSFGREDVQAPGTQLWIPSTLFAGYHRPTIATLLLPNSSWTPDKWLRKTL